MRAYVQRIAPAIISRAYYDGDEDSFAATPSAMARHLRTMLDGLVKVAIEHGSPALAEHLRSSIKKHGEPKLPTVTFRKVTEAAALAAASPAASHSIDRWFRPRIASRLKGEGIATIGELIAFAIGAGAAAGGRFRASAPGARSSSLLGCAGTKRTFNCASTPTLIHAIH